MPTTKVFLSLSFVDKDFVAQVRQKLPAGVAYFYEASFENGELLLDAMERSVADAAIFVLFASKAGQQSPWVGFEIDQARLQHIQTKNHRVLIFPTDSVTSVQDLPVWLRSHWVAQAGLRESDIARYITNVLLEPNVGASPSAPRIVGRGKTLDKLEQISADSVMRNRISPNVFFLTGFRGVGRRTFAAYYMRSALSVDVNLAYGPSLSLSPSADLVDVYQALQTEIAPPVSVRDAIRERAAFEELRLEAQVGEIIRLIGHFSSLGQAVIIVSAGGFFEDRGGPKEWVLPLLVAIPREATVFLISNRQLPPELVQATRNVVQMRVDELDAKDTKALMIRTAEKLRVPEFPISDALLRAIGGHADVANAAVRLISIKGSHILERDPRQLFNIQNTILGENIEGDALDSDQKAVLSLLSWVPSLSGDLLEKVLAADGVTSEQFIIAMENLVLGCLVVVSGNTFAISPAIRFLFRRFNPTSSGLLKMFSGVLSEEWKKADRSGVFRGDLFEAFVFMHSLEGAAMPAELRPLLTPGMLSDVMRDTYARGKDDPENLGQVILWGELSEDMKMSEATREEVLSTIARAKIRLGKYPEAENTISKMAEKGYRSVPFLRGHSYRRQRNYPRAIEMLVEATRSKKFNRSAVHELALAYKKSNRLPELRSLLDKHRELIRDSAMFADFQIGVDLARGDLPAADSGIQHLRAMPDDNGLSDVRSAQLLMRRQQYEPAKDALTRLIGDNSGDNLRLRSIRAVCAARSGDFSLARKDIDFVSRFPAWINASVILQASLLIEQRQPKEARVLLDKLSNKGAEEWILYARALEVESDLPETLLVDRSELKRRATELRALNNFAFEYDFGEA
jgi:tetratricopeptide (TPR) repeat protein